MNMLMDYIEENGTGPDDLIFLGADGDPIEQSNFRNNHWTPMLKELALPYHLTPHSLRHTWGSDSIAAGVPVALVAESLGHSSSRTTEQFYVHPVDSNPDEVADLREALMKKRNGRKLAS